VGTNGAAAAVVCVDADLDDCDASAVVDGVFVDVDVATIALADEVEVGIMYERGCPGSVIVPESVGRAADLSPEQMLYKASVSVLLTVASSHTASVHE